MRVRSFLKVSLLLVCILAVFSTAPFAYADNGTDTAALRNAVTLAGVRAHQQALQNIANANGGTRASTTPGYEASGVYVEGQLLAAGYNVSRQNFNYDVLVGILEQTAPNAVTYTYGVDFFDMTFSPTGNVTAPVQAVDLQLATVSGTTSGCEASDFAGFVPGNIALIRRGGCTFRIKADNAAAADASGVIIFNDGDPTLPGDRLGLFGGTLGSPGVTIPVVSTSYARGVEFDSLIASGLTMHLELRAETRQSFNVIAETRQGRTDRVVVVGAHLDSVPAGPGINDNGSGTATILEIALQMAELGIEPRNQVRFAFWGTEEEGLIGSAYYVSQLNTRQIKNIAVNLNFDMVGSPNFVRFVYDGDGSGTGTAGPNGSKVVEDVFNDYFAGQSLATDPTAFDGRSDYGPFIAVGIPAGGLFTGAEGIKTAAQAAVYGGTAGLAYDPCYHQACDTFANNSATGLDQMADAAAHATLTFAMTTSAVNGTDKGKAWKGTQDMMYWGSDLRK
jgi:Zn-dependent M28 family amino/carboxypeptidase